MVNDLTSHMEFHSGLNKFRPWPRPCFWDEESSAIKNYMDIFHKATKVTAQHVASFLVWLSSELGNFNDYEKGRAAREVNDVAIGRYDWRIQKYQNRGEGRKW